MTSGNTPDADHRVALNASRDWLVTALLVGLIVALLICAAVGLIAWDRAPVGATE